MIRVFRGITEYNEAFDNGFCGKAVVLTYFNPFLMKQRIMGGSQIVLEAGGSQIVLEAKEGWTRYSGKSNS